jgi:S-adenosylmethionine:tRNA ribosyltransferase-isomerase
VNLPKYPRSPRSADSIDSRPSLSTADLKTSSYHYDLPPDLIAQTPAETRDRSRLLALNRETGAVEHHHFSDLVDLLQPGDLLVANESKVLPARLRVRKAGTGGRVELLLLRSAGENAWEALVRPSRRVPSESVLVLPDGCALTVGAATAAGGRVIHFPADPIAILERWGEMPLPPYIRQPAADPTRYQTVYAHTPGSAAAPTAGLHFTPELIERLRARGVGFARVTLHVGLGTFRPVDAADVRDHQIHTEWCSLGPETAAAIARTREIGGRVIAVGTTSVRVLESAVRRTVLSPGDVENEMGDEVQPFSGETSLFIYPGFEFRVVDAIITNFHLPESSLLMLISAFAGRERVLAAYGEAVRERYRFFSFGDAMIIYSPEN